MRCWVLGGPALRAMVGGSGSLDCARRELAGSAPQEWRPGGGSAMAESKSKAARSGFPRRLKWWAMPEDARKPLRI